MNIEKLSDFRAAVSGGDVSVYWNGILIGGRRGETVWYYRWVL